MKNTKNKERRNPFDSESLKEMNSFKTTFLLNLCQWAIAACVFAFVIFCVYLLSVATSYFSPNLESFYSEFLLLNPILQVVIGVVLAVLFMALATTLLNRES